MCSAELRSGTLYMLPGIIAWSHAAGTLMRQHGNLGQFDPSPHPSCDLAADGTCTPPTWSFPGDLQLPQSPELFLGFRVKLGDS